MAIPISEQIVQDVARVLSAVSVNAGYQNTLAVTRELPEGISPKDGTTIVEPANPIQQQGPDVPCMLDEFDLPIGIVCYAIESEESDTAISTRLYALAADVRKAMGADIYRGGRAINTTFDQDELFTDELPASVLVTAHVRFRTLYNNQYQR